MKNDSMLAGHPLNTLLTRWEVRSRDALPADAMLVNLHVRELRQALATPEPTDRDHDAGATGNKAAQDNARESHAAGQLDTLNDDLIAILGRPNFTCIRIAQALRLCGVEIKSKAEHEQAAVIHFLLKRFLRHGADWATHSDADLRAMLDQVEAKNKAAMGAPRETGERDTR